MGIMKATIAGTLSYDPYSDAEAAQKIAGGFPALPATAWQWYGGSTLSVSKTFKLPDDAVPGPGSAPPQWLGPLPEALKKAKSGSLDIRFPGGEARGLCIY